MICLHGAIRALLLNAIASTSKPCHCYSTPLLRRSINAACASMLILCKSSPFIAIALLSLPIVAFAFPFMPTLRHCFSIYAHLSHRKPAPGMPVLCRRIALLRYAISFLSLNIIAIAKLRFSFAFPCGQCLRGTPRCLAPALHCFSMQFRYSADPCIANATLLFALAALFFAIAHHRTAFLRRCPAFLCIADAERHMALPLRRLTMGAKAFISPF